MSELRVDRSSEAVHLTVSDLPTDVAHQIREAQQREPEFVKRILLYGIVHRTVFETLRGDWRG